MAAATGVIASIRRRDFFLGAAATAAVLLGSGFVMSGKNSKTEAEIDAMIKRLKAAKDEEIARIKAEKEFAIKKAQADKYIAIQEVGDQKADQGLYTNTDTVGFFELKKEFPWLETLRKTVASLKFENGFGSAVLLDKSGTITLCAHELPNRAGEKIRLFFNTKANGHTIEVEPYNFLYDKKHDLMFATIDPALIRKYDLLPVRWGRMGDDIIKKDAGKEIISVGWPAPSFRLHATRGFIAGVSLTDRYHTNLGGVAILNCKVKANGVTFGGMSGGGVFSDEKFVGIVNASSAPGSDASTDFTPVDLIRETYVGLYPVQARKAGIGKIDNSNAPAECRFNNSEILSRLESRFVL